MIGDLAAGVWEAELEDLFQRVAHRFGRIEPRRRMRDYVRGLLGPVGRKNGWQLAEYAGHPTPDGLQRLLSWCRWDADAVRDDLQEYVAEKLGQPDGVLIIDDTGFIKKGTDLWTINGRPFNAAETLARPRLGTVERWRLSSDFHHPVHLHMAHFQVLSRGGPPPEASDAGWKDTVDVRPYEVVEILARFDGYHGRFMLHCHNLEHEDMAMMANFEVV